MKKTKAFTLLEILAITLVLGIGLVSIFQTANHAKLASQRVTQSIIANQIATEGVEILYQFRNTNFLKHQHRDINGKDLGTNISNRHGNKCRIAFDYENSDNIDANCNDRLGSGYYYIETNDEGLNKIAKCDDDECKEHIASATGIIDNKYAICLTGGVRTPCPEGHEEGGDQSPYGKFYRTIRGIGIYDMASNETGGTLIENNLDAENAYAQEYRFCSMVARRGGQNGELEICSTMTNFIE